MLWNDTQRPTVTASVLAVGLMLLAGLPAWGDEKPPPPAAAEVAKVVRQMRIAYAGEYARRNSDDRYALAKLLMRESGDSDRPPIEQYAMLTEAHDLAMQAGRPSMAYTAVIAMARRYAIDALAMKQAIVTTAARSVRDAKAADEIIHIGFVVVDQLIATDQYDRAMSVVTLLRQPTAKTENRSLAERVTGLTRQIANLRAAYRRVQGYLKQLEAQPDEPNAAEAVGRFYALTKGDWDRGLPLLTKGADETLADLARRDLANPQDADAMLALADAYWKLGQANAASEVGTHFKTRSSHWYRRVLPKLEGLAYDAAAKRAASSAAEQWAGMSFEPGIVGRYYEGHDDRKGGVKQHLLRVDEQIDFDWDVGRPAPKMPDDWFQIDWVGWLRPPAEGEYRIAVNLRGGGGQLHIDDQLVLGSGGWSETTVYLSKAFVPIRLTYRHRGGPAEVSLQWLKPGDEQRQPIGRGALFHRLDEQRPGAR